MFRIYTSPTIELLKKKKKKRIKNEFSKLSQKKKKNEFLNCLGLNNLDQISYTKNIFVLEKEMCHINSLLAIYTPNQYNGNITEKIINLVQFDLIF